jgi:guanidinopropionase
MSDPFFRPVSGMELPRFAGVPTFMRLPLVPPDHPRASEVEIGIVGIPWDGGTSNRPGARHGPRALRDASTMIRAEHPVTGYRPFDARRIADLGDIGPNPVDAADTLARIEAAIAALTTRGTRPLSVGGDHLTTLAVLRGLAKGAPLGLIHFDSHTDLFPAYFGGKALTHGNPFRVAVEEGLLDPKRAIQIGIRGTSYDKADRDFAKANGIRIVTIEEFFACGTADVMAEARSIAGAGLTYVSYDIDFVDPAFAPGTGTPEVGGPNSFQALDVVRGLSGVRIAAADLVEVSPPFDPLGTTAWLGASILFELLCAMG